MIKICHHRRIFPTKRWLSNTLAVRKSNGKIKNIIDREKEVEKPLDINHYTHRLFDELYDEAVKVSRDRIPILESKLYDTKVPTKSILDELQINDWRQKPAKDAINDTGNDIQTNVLSFNCPNSLLIESDFMNAYPQRIHRRYNHSIDKLMVIKKRNPMNLMFENTYYLIFPSYLDASVYYMETKNKDLNGFPMKLKFQTLSPILPHLTSPFFHVLNDKVDKKNPFKLVPELQQSLQMLKDSDTNDNYKQLSRFASYQTRKSYVLVKNLPFGLSKFTLQRLLWDYEFPPSLKQHQCFRTVIRDQVKQVNMMLITFKNVDSAKRFIRTFHGQRLITKGSKRFYEPLYCEIVY
ncbi:hypothetical protein CLIB1444_02S08460 [[Candida] jaroonii]|uniref:Uncharacterized protein n=1 Tax=[Candida] jaroonii TaxID=467808 RepID=A0ACA9Y3B2_9ASCO|nr:hypothetical protein CLIB1444_02S08460 [[Candida] jaroonii]